MGVVGIKAGTKTFSEAPQNEITKSSGIRTSAATAGSPFEGQNIGDIANKIADPNWVDPTKKMRAVGNDKLDKEAFMKLMLAQMKNQDPMNPMESHELAAQLAQFSSVEQLNNVNDTLVEMKNGQKPTESFQALNFIGKAVAGDSSKLVRAKGDKQHDIGYKLPEDAPEVKIQIKNDRKETIRTVTLTNMKSGDNSFEWNGLDERGLPAPSGEYSFVFEAKAANEKKLAVKTDFQGVISGVNYTPEGPVLLVGTQSVKLKDVKKIVDPSLMRNDQKTQTGPSQDLKNQQGITQTNNKPNQSQVVAQNAATSETEVAGAGDPVDATPSQIMDSVKMSNEMMARLQKETK